MIDEPRTPHTLTVVFPYTVITHRVDLVPDDLDNEGLALEACAESFGIDPIELFEGAQEITVVEDEE